MNQSKILADAIQRASIYHFSQSRKDVRNGIALPYLVHPLEVLKKVWDWGVSDLPTLLACIYHDFEDCVGDDPNGFMDRVVYAVRTAQVGEPPYYRHTEEQLPFIDKATEIVKELTLVPEIVKEDYLKSFQTKSVQALVIKVADRLCNSMDFYHSGDRKYAWKYLRKADCVFEAFYDRNEEIVKFFGEDVYKNARDNAMFVEEFLRTKEAIKKEFWKESKT